MDNRESLSHSVWDCNGRAVGDTLGFGLESAQKRVETPAWTSRGGPGIMPRARSAR